MQTRQNYRLQQFCIEGHTSIAYIKKQQCYYAAKHGNLDAAKELVAKCIKKAKIEEFRRRFYGCTALPVISQNMLPLALALELKIPIKDTVYVSGKIRKTMNAMERMVFKPVIQGSLGSGAYILIDDILTTGGMMNHLKEFVLARGGQPVAGMVLAFAAGSSLLQPPEDKLREITAKFGPRLPHMLEQFGLPSELHRMTNSQISYLLRFSSLGQIRKRISYVIN